ncbi:phasin family protein [Aromatoleum diolicum]|uniref:TIGR01841 family phasin n=1 Tax=Aromatoleum diolicum TaxID=75796 RepID=A0ABX1Q8B2_9RHOO|nr:phasin family protein [Aromatoleum diolicum]NMG74310.1 TIGR01841 family phasin [Aromatoleum diolicum]
MSTKSINNIAAQTHAVDAFLDLARIYLASTERLSELALSAARTTLDDCASATQAASRMINSRDLSALNEVLGQPVFERTLAYSRNAMEIITQGQQEAAQVLSQKFPLAGVGFPVTADWNAALEMFTRGVRELSAATAANVTAATDAGSKFAAGATLVPKKAA